MPLAPNVIAVLLNLLFFALALPLALKQVPMQYLYGYRTSRSTKNEKCWYAANAAFALPVIVISGAAAVAGAVMLGVRYGTELPFWEYGFALLYIPIVAEIVIGAVCAERALDKLAAEEGAETDPSACEEEEDNDSRKA